MKLSVILPVYSEEDSLIYVVDKLEKLLRDKLYEIILIVSPKSDLKTLGISKNLVKKYKNVKFFIQKQNPGLGRGVREGIQHAKGTHILMMDSDGEMLPDTVPKMIKKMEETGCDMVIGSRWAKGGGVVGYDIVKYFLNRGFQTIFRILFLTKIHDLTLGFKLMKRKIIDDIKFDSDFHDIAVETTLKPIKRGFKVEEVPTVWKARKQGVSKNKMSANFKYFFKAISIYFS